jgi:hypothetical protein
MLMSRNKESDWIIAGAVAWFVVRVLPWLVILAILIGWLISHVRFV